MVKKGGIWIKEHGMFLRVGKAYYNAYPNENKKGNQPDFDIYLGTNKEAEGVQSKGIQLKKQSRPALSRTRSLNV